MVNLSLSKCGGSIVPLCNSAVYQVYGQLYAPAALPPEKVHVVWSPELGWKSGKDARFLLLSSMSLACLWLTMWYKEGWYIQLFVASWKKTVISSNKHTASGIPEQAPTQHCSWYYHVSLLENVYVHSPADWIFLPSKVFPFIVTTWLCQRNTSCWRRSVIQTNLRQR
jgi:hypothetical protein